MTLRHPNSVFHEGNNQFKGMGVVKWCALCGVHRPVQGGSIRDILGGRHYCCALHSNPKDVKCQPTPKKMTPLTPKKKMTKRDIAQAAMELVKVNLMARDASPAVDPVKSGESEISTTSTNQNPRR